MSCDKRAAANWGAVQPASARDARSMLNYAPAVGVGRINTRLTHRRDGAPRLVELTVAAARLVPRPASTVPPPLTGHW